MAEEIWGERWTQATSDIAKKYMEISVKKKSLVCLAADRNTMQGLFDLIEEVGPHIAALKTHVDLVDDWTPESWSKFCEKANDADLLIFEIGNLPILVKLRETKCLEFTILDNGVTS